jgi:hypothetical protein
MRLRQDRITELGHRKRTVVKSSEGTPKTVYGDMAMVDGYSWSAGGQVQAEQYGDTLPYVRNVRLASAYKEEVQDGVMHYILLADGVDIVERDLLIIDGLEYEIRCIRPDRHLYMEVVRI